MKLVEKKTRRNISLLESKKSQMVCEILNHPAWVGKKSFFKLESLLQNNPSFTYLLSEGIDKYHFFLSYVSIDGLVKHKNIRIVFANGKGYWKNGGYITYEAIHELIPNCLACSKRICRPLASN